MRRTYAAVLAISVCAVLAGCLGESAVDDRFTGSATFWAWGWYY